MLAIVKLNKKRQKMSICHSIDIRLNKKSHLENIFNELIIYKSEKNVI